MYTVRCVLTVCALLGLGILQLDLGIPPEEFVPVTYTDHTSVGNLIGTLLPTLLLIGESRCHVGPPSFPCFCVCVCVLTASACSFAGAIVGLSLWQMRGSGGGMSNVFKIGKATPSTVAEGQPKVKFKDVAGCDGAKVRAGGWCLLEYSC